MSNNIKNSDNLNKKNLKNLITIIFFFKKSENFEGEKQISQKSAIL